MAPHSEQKLAPRGRAFAVPLYQTLRKSMFDWLCVDLPQLTALGHTGSWGVRGLAQWAAVSNWKA